MAEQVVGPPDSAVEPTGLGDLLLRPMDAEERLRCVIELADRLPRDVS